MEGLTLIDVSVEDDLLFDIASPPHASEVFHPHFWRIFLVEEWWATILL